jgi:cytochrome c
MIRRLELLVPTTLLLCACVASEEPPRIAAGDAESGRLLLEQYACGSCHVIPGVGRANGLTGPTLEAFGRRVYIAGELPNQPELLVQWIRQPHSLVNDTLMPDQNVPRPHATDMGAYLMGLR